MRDRGMRAENFGGTAERLPEIPKQRAALFGRSVYTAVKKVEESGARDALEEDNNRLVAELESKVSALKHATQSIHDEVSEQNRILGGMGIDFDRAGGLMTGALQRLDGLVRGGRGGQGYMCNVVVFTVLLFLVMWWLLGKR